MESYQGNYKVSRSAVLLDGECSEAFDVEQGVAQGCSLSPILLSVFINGLLKEVEQASLAGADPGGGGGSGCSSTPLSFQKTVNLLSEFRYYQLSNCVS